MIGAKTLVTLLLLAGGVVTALALGVLTPERLSTRDWGTLFLVGCFGIVVGTLMFRFWRLGEKSRHYFRWTGETSLWESAEAHFLGTDQRRVTIGENRGEAFDLGPHTLHAVCVATALLLALTCIDARALSLLGRFQRSLTAATSSYCPEPEAETTTTLDPNAPGCELVRRAYALGYADSLGDCEARKKSDQSASAPCKRRQRDEPVFHYAWRLLAGSWSNLRSHTGSAYMQKLRHDFGKRVDHLDSLRSAQRQVLASAPHASHHIWTNLPDPGDGAFRARDCADRYRSLAHRPAPEAGSEHASKVFEHIVAQLLFESSYEPAAGYCREYHVHWSAAPDTCQRLAANPEAVLTEAGLFGEVRAVLDRYRLVQELETPAAPKQSLEPSAFLSFQCYVEAQGPARKSTPFLLAGHRFTAEEVRVPPSARGATLYVDRYDAVAQVLVHGFHYGALMSEAGLEQSGANGLEAAFAGHDFLLSRLYGLDSLDIYLGAGWIADRPDLLEVYPYQRHLKNYVQIFRRQYRRERGRL